ncbi:hypothetical protein [Desulfopila sp. IMCC35008]|uniref:hypothetical protein n=1 Tax=Desulfopila sp. IMCC35008 TaxID=2653858 RepID=UPI0013D3859C|nr:hypothetical protein [Desulfopila sp. IMCC35008]
MQVESMTSVSAFDLFPDIFAPPPELKDRTERTEITIEFDAVPAQSPIRHVPGKSIRKVPAPPDVSWLKGGVEAVDGDTDADLRRCLVVTSDRGERARVLSAIDSLDFAVHVADNPNKAMEMLKCSAYSLLICNKTDAMPRLHDYVAWLPMTVRRTMYYTLIGPDLRTLYSLEALSLSANMVVCDKDIHHLGKILMRGFNDYEKLYRPFLNEVKSKAPLLA